MAINTELRSRFIDAFQADDALASAVDGMDAADFEGDQAAKQRLTDQYNGQLDDRAGRGDYETLGMAIAKDARSFVKDYNPIQQNKKKYDTWLQSVKDLQDLGDEKGGITSVTAQLAREEAKHNYAGLQYDDSGNLVEDSYFAGANLVKDVNLEKRMQEEMKDVVERKNSSSIESPLTGVGLMRDSNGDVVIGHSKDPNGEIKYWVTTEKGIEYISADLVKEATERVLKHDDVQASLSQKARLQNFKLDAIGENGEMEVTNRLDNYEMQLEEAMAELEAKVASGDTQAETDLNELQEELNSVRSQREEQGEMATMNNLSKDAMMSDFQNSNLNKYEYYNEEYEESYDVDEIWKMSAKKRLDKSTETVSSISGAVELPPLGGNSSEGKIEFIEDSNIAYNTEAENLIKIGGGEVTPEAVKILHQEIDDIENFTDEGLKDLADKYGYDDTDLFRTRVTEIITIKQKRDLVQQKMNETEDALQEAGVMLSDDEINAQYGANVETSSTGANYSGADLKNAMVKAGMIDPNATVKDALDYLYRIDPTGRSNKVLQNEQLMAALEEAHGSTLPADYTPAQRKAALALLANKHLSGYAVLRKDVEKKLDAEYDKNIKSDMGWNMNWWGNKESTAKVQEAWENKFATNAVWSNLDVIDPNTGEPVSASKYFADMNFWTDVKAEEIKVDTKNIGLLSVSRADGKSMLVVPIIDKDGNAHELMVPSYQFQNESMDAWTGSAEYMAARMWNDGVHTNLPNKNYSPNLFDGNVRFDYANNVIYINNKPYSKQKGLALVANQLHSTGLAPLHGGKEEVDETAFDFTKTTNK